jgi:hypothetical protein
MKMAYSDSTPPKVRAKLATAARTKPRKSSGDQPPTVAERNRAIRKLRPLGGAHRARPINSLVEDTPANTIERCKGILRWVVRLDRVRRAGILSDPFSGGELGEAATDVLRLAADALEHAEKVIRSVGSLADAEVAAHG